MEQQKAVEYLEKSIEKYDKISHAYFIETNNCENYQTFLKIMVKKILFKNILDEDEKSKINVAIENKSYPDLKYINSDGYWIKKEQLLSLEKEFSKKSMLNNKLIYIIDGADKLNDSAANTILKFLEEPNDDIVAILVAPSRYNVIDTIISRCQIITLINNNLKVEETEELSQFVSDMLENKKMIIRFDYYLETLFKDREMSRKTLEQIEIIFYKYINHQNVTSIVKSIDVQKIIRVLDIIYIQKEKLNYNVNIKLWLNELIVRLTEVM